MIAVGARCAHGRLTIGERIGSSGASMKPQRVLTRLSHRTMLPLHGQTRRPSVVWDTLLG